MTRVDPRDRSALETMHSLGIDPDAPDALTIGPGGVDLLPRPDEHEIVTAQKYLEYLCTNLGLALADLMVHPWVIATFQRTTFDLLCQVTGAAPAPAWAQFGRKVWQGQVGSVPVTIVRLNIGASVAITGMEELIATGGQHFIVLGTAGALQPDLPLGSLIIPTSTIREEGTSFHYIPAGTDVLPDSTLVAALQSASATLGLAPRQGAVWTTDAPYRELASKIQTYRALGVLGVEMEAAALFAVASLRGVRLALVVAISDHLGDTWRPAFLSPDLRASADHLVATALRCIADLAAS